MARLPAGWIFIPKFKDMTTITVEQRELVCCKDCKHLEHLGHLDELNGKECYVCRKHTFTGMREEEWFCADGRRKEVDE